MLASLEFLLTVGGSISGSFAGFSISLLVSLELLAISDSFTRDSDSEINWNYSQFVISQKIIQTYVSTVPNDSYRF